MATCRARWLRVSVAAGVTTGEDMFEWLDSVAGPGYAAAVLWTFAALVLLVIVLVIVKLIRSLTFGTFVAGGRNRKTRLAVMDATAVDSQRRLVLVRRDDIEHLLLIGGPTDVVVERDIRLGAPRRPALTAADNVHEVTPMPRPPVAARQPVPVPAAQQAPAQPAPQAPAPAAPQAPARPSQPAPAPRPTLPSMPVATPLPTGPAVATPAAMPVAAPKPYVPAPVRPTPAPAVTPTPMAAPAPVAAPIPPVAPARREEIDETLMKELEVSLDEPQGKQAPDPSLDDEMARLLGELTNHRK